MDPFHDDAVGLMKVSIARGIYKNVDVDRVSRGAHYTESDSWLTKPVRCFIEESIAAGVDQVLDPFAGDGHLIRAIEGHYPQVGTAGFDLNVPKWQRNDSLVHIAASKNSMICTNPPYLAKYSAKRKGVAQLVKKYFDSTRYDDLYLLAISKMLDAKVPVVAILPETFIASGEHRGKLERVVILEKNNPFLTTDTPACVACFNAEVNDGPIKVFRDNNYLGTLTQLCKEAILDGRDEYRRLVRFNVSDGWLALKAVDGTAPDDKIRFMLAHDFDYRSDMIKVSSRLMTRIEVSNVRADRHEALAEQCNHVLASFRAQCQDVALSPFKGNNKAGRRRRRLDYALARKVIATAIGQLGLVKNESQQQALL